MGVRRLSSIQIQNAIHDLLGPAVTAPAYVLPGDETFRFSSVASTHVVTGSDVVEEYSRAAFNMAHQALTDATRRAAIVGCSPAAVTDPCLDGFLTAFGRRVLRRPLEPEEVEAYRRVLGAGAGAGDVWTGIEHVIAGLLQDASFIYMPLVGEPDPGQPDRNRVTSYEMASHLSFTLLDTTPDIQLLDAAERGELLTDEGVAQQTDRLLASPRARATIARFFSEHYGYFDLEQQSKDPTTYARYTLDLTTAMRTELDMTLSELALDPKRSLVELFDSRRTYLNRPLADLYRVMRPAGMGFEATTFGDTTPRAGILTMAGLLSSNAFATRTSPTRRGIFVRERLLCQEVPPPPPNVDTNLDDDPSAATGRQTARDRLTRHRADPSCVSCHAFFDPIGLALEHYDGIGFYRPYDGTLPIDPSGELDGKPFADALELGQLLKADPHTRSCLVTALYQHALGSEEAGDVAAFLRGLDTGVEGGQQVIRKLLVALVTSPAFRTVGKTL